MIQIDLEIPKCCDECKFIYDSCCCIITGSRIDWDKFDSERLLDCPLNKIAEPKTGHWIEHPEIETSTPEYLMFYECSECGDKQCFCKSDIHKKHFCNNCGARMVEPQESEVSNG